MNSLLIALALTVLTILFVELQLLSVPTSLLICLVTTIYISIKYSIYSLAKEDAYYN